MKASFRQHGRKINSGASLFEHHLLVAERDDAPLLALLSSCDEIPRSRKRLLKLKQSPL